MTTRPYRMKDDGWLVEQRAQCLAIAKDENLAAHTRYGASIRIEKFDAELRERELERVEG